MRFSSTACLASLLFFALTAAAQSGTPATAGDSSIAGESNTHVVVKIAPPGIGCPVSLSARQTALGQSLAVQTDRRATAADHGMRVQFGEHEGSPIVGATVRVWGLSPHGRLLPAAVGANPDVSKQFELELAGKKGMSEVWMAGVSALVRVDVTELRYADGSVWRASGTERCTATPDGFTQVASTR